MKNHLKERVEKALYIDNDASVERDYEPWILEPLIPYKAITILDGLGGSGKSWFALDLSYAISTGIGFTGKFPAKRRGTVLYLTAEEIPQMFVKRLDMIRKYYPENKDFKWLSLLDENLDIIPSMCKKSNGEPVTTEMFDVLEYLISTRRPILVVIDSMINFYGLNENSSDDAIFFFESLKSLIRKYKTSFLLLHHQNKEGMKAQADDVASFRGSGTFREQARSRIIYKNIKTKNNINVRKIILEKNNYYSNLIDNLPIYLKFENGIHIYDKRLEEYVKQSEELWKNSKYASY